MSRITDQAGFTLLEVLIALALTALVTSGLFAAAGMSERARQKTVQASDSLAERSSGLARLHGMIESALPVRLPTEDGRLRLGFAGASDRLMLYVRQPGAGLPPDLYRLDMRLAAHEAKTGLTVTVDSQASLILPYNGILLHDLPEARFSYYGAPTGKPAAWHDDWPASDRAPVLVKLTFRSNGHDHVMAVRPRLLPASVGAEDVF